MNDLTKIRAKLIIQQPFFGMLAMRLIVRESQVPTAATDGENLFYNQQWIDSLNEEELKGVLCHEIMHIVLKHPFRMRPEYDARLWNIACDYAVNYLLKRESIILPKNHLYNSKYEDWSAEQIYEDLKKQDTQQNKDKESKQQGPKQTQTPNQPEENQQPAEDPGECGAVLPYPKKGNKEQSAVKEKEWEMLIASGYSFDSCSDSLKKVLTDVLYPSVDWKLLLRDFLDHSTSENYFWNIPNKRHLYRDIYLPSIQNEQEIRIILAIDVSGSIVSSRDLVEKFLQEASAILSLMKTQIKVLLFSEEIVQVIEYEPGDPIEIDSAIGGGTDFRCIFRWISEQEENPKAVLILTDLDGEMPPTEPDYPVLWAVPSYIDKKAKFGQVIKIL